MRHFQFTIDRLAVAGLAIVVLACFIPVTAEPLRSGLHWIGVAVVIGAGARRLVLPLIDRHQLRRRRGKSELEFHPELFEVRTRVLETLADNDFIWLSDFGAVDLQHDVYGLEVTAIRSEDLAIGIERLLSRVFPKWRHRRIFFEDQNVGELGWKVMISRFPEDLDDSTWKSNA
jgi:hypothetical protein